jgi:hypothetical protein
MAIQNIKQLVDARLLTTRNVLGALDATIIELAIEEVKAIHDFDDKKDSDLSSKEKIYIADLAAIKLLQESLDRYKEDSQTKTADGLIDEAQDKFKYLKELIDQYRAEANKLAVKLGLAATGMPPPLIIKVGAADESGA